MAITTVLTGASLANAMVNHEIIDRSFEEYAGATGGIFAFAVIKPLPENKETDTISVEGFNEFSDSNTDTGAPSPLISRRANIDNTLSDAPLLGTNFNKNLQLGMYGRHQVITQYSTRIKARGLIEGFSKKLMAAAGSDGAKLAMRSFDELDAIGGAYVRFGSAVASEVLVVNTITVADVRAAVVQLQTNRTPSVKGSAQVDNDFTIKRIKPCLVLLVSPGQALDIIANFTGANEFIPYHLYAKNGETAVIGNDEEVGLITKFDTPIRVIKSDFVKGHVDAANSATAGMRQSGGTNITYHAILMGADAYMIPGLGKTVDVDIRGNVAGKEVRIKSMPKGIDFFVTPPVRTPTSDPYGQHWAVGYTFTMGDTALNAGGMLLKHVTNTGTAFYNAVKIITTATA